MKTKFLSILAVLLCAGYFVSHAQSGDSLGSITFQVDSRADVLAEKQARINGLSTYKNSNGKYKGYRIMVLNTNDRELASRTRADILRYFPGVMPYTGYQAPFFKLKAGDFLKREDAERVCAHQPQEAQVARQRWLVVEQCLFAGAME